MTRAALFDTVRPWLDDKGYTPDRIAALDALADKIGLPREASAAPTGVTLPDDYWPMLARIESGNNPMAKAGTSTGSGLYQFLKATWIGEGGAWGRDTTKPFGGLSPSRDEQTARVKTFTAKNALALLRGGVAINRATLYAAHFFGAGTAVKVITADVKARADLIAGEGATKANPSILKGKTVGEFLSWLKGKTGEWAR